MNKIKLLLILICLHIGSWANAQYQTTPNKKGSKYYTNPIFAGDYPDPTIIRDGDDYYATFSSFERSPGLPIWHSKDLISWAPVTNALNKYTGSVWAPDMVKCNNKYYIYFPLNHKLFVVVADSMAGPWSDPVDLGIHGIDPGHVVDENGKRFLYSANGGFVPLSDDGLSITGEAKHAYSGWPIPRDWTIECMCLEGPKLMKRGDYYYLTVAQGGTAGPPTGHMIISARSKSIAGPWENSPYNPILRTESSDQRWWSKGHGTPFEDENGDWWMIYHAYEKGFYNMGRQTLLLPLEWTEDGWYKVPNGINDEKAIKRPQLAVMPETNAAFTDNFIGGELNPQWAFYDGYDLDRFEVKDKSVVIKAKGDAIGNCSPLLYNPSHHAYTAEVEMLIEGNATGGLVLVYNKEASSGILANGKDILANIRGWQFTTEKDVTKERVFLKVKSIDNIVDMYYSTNGEDWIKIENSLEVSGLHHNALGGFLSVRIGLCSIGAGSVNFKNFKYEPIN
ncbi:MAG: family 43 glycosylhydrolase [Cyclobacteriaceae bacterium]